jgi:hypothetical protein
MSTPSNSYADKIYSEHPIALWALDEEIPEDITVVAPYTLNKATSIKNVVYLYTGQKAIKYGTASTSVDCGYYTYSPSEGYTVNSDGNVVPNSLYSNVENGGVPMVYGASNVSELYPSYFYKTDGSITDEYDNPLYIPHPSLLIPGKGFLNKDGQYRDLTIEFWMRMQANVLAMDGNKPLRFFGPVASDDGLYIINQTIILKVGNFFTSHYLGELDRPILVNIVLQSNGATLMINGDAVGQINYNARTQQNFPNKIGDHSKEQDWLGFFTYDSVKFSVDCVAIYPKALNTIVAKKHFAYGQAVEFPQEIVSKHGGQSFNTDYSVSNYASNVNYPSNQKWSSGVSNNIQQQGSVISLPKYELPNFYFYKNNKLTTVETALQDTSNSGTIGLSFVPTSDYTKSYAKFDSLPLIPGKKMSAFYSIVDFSNFTGSAKQTIFKFFDKSTKNTFSLTGLKSGGNVIVSGGFTINGTYSEIYNNTMPIADGATDFFALDIDTYAELHGSSFLNDNQSSLVVYLGGDESGIGSFTGKIYNFGFFDREAVELNQKNADRSTGTFYPLFGENGFISLDYQYASSDQKVKPTYGLVFKNIGSFRYPDIQASGYWQDEVAFSRLSKYIDGSHRFDMIQVNNGVTPATFVNSNINQLEFIDTKINPIKMYAQVGTQSLLDSVWWTNLSRPTTDMVVTETSSEIIDGSVILPTVKYSNQSVFANQLLSVAVEFFADGIFTNPINLKTLQVSSQVNDTSTIIGSRFGGKLKPYQGSEDLANPYKIYKYSSPHAYFTGNTGIELVGNFDKNYTRGLALNINQSSAADFFVSSLQFAINYNRDWVDPSGIFIMEINSQTTGREKIKIMASRATEPLRLNRTPKLNLSCHVETITGDMDITSEIQFYVDGHLVDNPSIEINEWSVIGIQFPSPLNCSDSKDYSINIIGPGLFNNIVYLRIPQKDFYSKSILTTWSSSLSGKQWTDLLSKTWEQNMFTQTSTEHAVPLDYLFNVYLGTNKIVIDPANNAELTLNNQPYSIYKNTSWLSQTIQPA